MIINIPGIQYPVLVASFAEEKKHSEEGMRFAISSGGFFSTYLDKTTVRRMADINKATLSDEDYACAMEVESGHCIVLYKEAAAKMTEEEVMGMLYHEEAHIFHGDLEQYRLLNKGGMIDDIEAELQADAYAVRRVGNGVYRQAMKKTFANMVGFMAEVDPAWAKKTFQNIITDVNVLTRFAKLDLLSLPKPQMN